MDIAPENYAFVMNVGSLAAESYELALGHILRRAKPDEITVIKDRIDKLSGDFQTPLRLVMWETAWPQPQPGPPQTLPDTEWRYYVIAFRGDNLVLSEIETASDLAPFELEIGFTIWPEMGNAILFHSDLLFRAFEKARFDPTFFVSVSDSAIQDITDIWSQLQRADNQLMDVRRLASSIHDLKAFPDRSPLKFLGYFAILESMLTHDPKPGDPYDSITRQVKKKIALLDNRWNPRIDYSPFSGVSAETVWSKMYAYRSALAHGGNPDFANDLRVLGTHEQALKLLKSTVKAVIRHALVEPRLLLDLREC